MLTRNYCDCILRPSEVAPSRSDLEVVGVFNPAATMFNGRRVLIVRIAERPREVRDGFVALPRWNAGEVFVDWVAETDLERLDPRVVRLKETGSIRLTFTSHLAIAFSTDGRRIDRIESDRWLPDGEMEEFGIEDPRLTKLDGRFYFTYVSVSRHGASTSLAVTDDFRTFQRLGVIFCCENKDVLLFPEKIGGDYVAMHRPNPATHFSPPEMWLARSPDLLHWGGHQTLHTGTSAWNSDRVGGGTPPIKTPAGWLTIYHGSQKSTTAGQVGTYTAGAILLSAESPQQIVGQTKQPIMIPSEPYETDGFVGSVVFPTGWVRDDDVLQVFYGAADSCIGVVEWSFDELLSRLVS